MKCMFLFNRDPYSHELFSFDLINWLNWVEVKKNPELVEGTFCLSFRFHEWWRSDSHVKTSHHGFSHKNIQFNLCSLWQFILRIVRKYLDRNWNWNWNKRHNLNNENRWFICYDEYLGAANFMSIAIDLFICQWKQIRSVPIIWAGYNHLTFPFKLSFRSAWHTTLVLSYTKSDTLLSCFVETLSVKENKL